MTIAQRDINPNPYFMADAEAAGEPFEGWSAARGYVVSSPPPTHVYGPAYLSALFEASREKCGIEDEIFFEGPGVPDWDYLAELMGEGA